MFLFILFIFILFIFILLSHHGSGETKRLEINREKYFPKSFKILLEDFFTPIKIEEYYRIFCKSRNEKINEILLNEMKKITFEKFLKFSYEEMLKYYFLTNEVISEFNKIKIYTSMKQKTFSTKNNYPRGLIIIDPKVDYKYIKNKLDEPVENKIFELFMRTKNTRIALIDFKTKEKTLNQINSESSLNPCANKELQQDSNLILKKIKEVDNKLYENMEKIIKIINLESSFDNYIIFIMKYTQSSGIRAHIDNITSTTGKVYTLNIGETIYYDLLPIFTTEWGNTPLRVEVLPGNLTIIQQEARFKWAHSIPNFLS